MAEVITLARPYAQAVFDLARDAKAFEQWSKSLDLAASIVAMPDVSALLSSPRVTRDEVAELVIAAGKDGFDEVGKNLIRTLADNRRLALLPEIAALFEVLRAQAEGRIQAEVVSAHDLDDKQLAKLSKALAKKLGREVDLTSVIDETLLGGAIVRAGDLIIDGSAKGKLDRLAAALSH